jgi:hypothetical protein
LILECARKTMDFIPPIVPRGQDSAVPVEWVNWPSGPAPGYNKAQRHAWQSYSPSPEPTAYSNSGPFAVYTIGDELYVSVAEDAGSGDYYISYIEATSDPAYPDGYRFASPVHATPHFAVYCAPGWIYDPDTDACVEIGCTCAPVVTASASDQTDDGFTLNVAVAAGDCDGPLVDIIWSPPPTSGQNSATAVYENCAYGTTYEGGVSAADDSTCAGSANFSFTLLPPQPPGPGDPSC